MYISPVSNKPSDPVEIPCLNHAKSHPSCPLEETDVSTPSRVAEYFPQDLISICSYCETAKTKAMEGLDSILSMKKEDRTFANTIFAMDELQAFLHSRIQALWVVSMTHIEKEELHPWQKYRKAILEPGGGVDPNKLLEDFLGRAPSLKAYHQSLNQ